MLEHRPLCLQFLFLCFLPSSSAGPTTTTAYAACKYHRRKCNPDCELAPYYPADQQRQFLNLYCLFGVSNIRKLDAQRLMEHRISHLCPRSASESRSEHIPADPDLLHITVFSGNVLSVHGKKLNEAAEMCFRGVFDAVDHVEEVAGGEGEATEQSRKKKES